MWIDDNGILNEIYKQFDEVKQFPALCPKCKKYSVHIYIHVHDKAKNAGLWVWCSNCHIFTHGSMRLKHEWENIPIVEPEKLCATPDYLDNIRDEIDKHVNSIKYRANGRIKPIECWACFSVVSYGEYDDTDRYVSQESDIFDPDEITHLLNVEPKYKRRYGEQRRGSNDTSDVYKSSKWTGFELSDPPIDRNEIGKCVVQRLMPYENVLIDYKKRNNVFYEIEICIFSPGKDIIIDSEMISFCNRAGVKIRFNTLLSL